MWTRLVSRHWEESAEDVLSDGATWSKVRVSLLSSQTAPFLSLIARCTCMYMYVITFLCAVDTMYPVRLREAVWFTRLFMERASNFDYVYDGQYYTTAGVGGAIGGNHVYIVTSGKEAH